MSFTIRHFEEKALALIGLTDEKSGTEVSLLPAYGATLHAFRVHVPGGGEPFNVIDGYADLDEVKKEMGISFKGPKLSPFPCRIAGAAYHIADRQFVFSRAFPDGTAIHGLLFDKAFEITQEEEGPAAAALTLQYRYRKEDGGYPFDYDCQVKYLLRPGNLLEVQTTVTNLDETTIPIADGWHPYFRLGGKIDDWVLRFDAEAIVEFNEQLIPSGRLLKYDTFNTNHLIGTTQLDNCFVLGPVTGDAGAARPVCEILNPANGLRIAFFPDAGYPYLQLYTPPGRQSIAVENLSAAPDCFNNKMGLILLPPGHSQTFTVNYKVGVE
jgi:aldose 1-epimerase